MKFKIATRKSKLAQVQTKIVMDLVKRICGSESEKVLIETTGDKRLDIALNKIGGKGLFIKEIERALLNNEVDAAVHSMKDVPFDIMDEFEIAAICKREDARDVFVSNGNVHFKNLRIGAQIGTSSNRRAAQIKKLRPDLNITPIRGNVQTRIDKMISQGLDGIVLAAAGVMRLNMEEIITDYFSIENVVPAIGQGALGVEIRSNSKHKNTFTKLNDENSRKCVEAERSFMRALNGDCHSTIGAYAEISGDTIYITGLFDLNGKLIKKSIAGEISHNIDLGKTLAELICRKEQ
ncbi:hydroxymethylbilane synthase [Clostridium tyrobutyricum]|uniref:hydroxymethylbilane synthase n=1 Tax=Clostridium tyrobutyricum TaxID=1519 RepID=UPI001C382F6E|nr:hydroxymethylbilane synthase [Clostridium tyrobutyricum]MBV4415936.1 hydroxymethylbilane synthase [Clostridium tyrobutyricum]MBV4421797.1 hydroxymethylbilane synthase [Clostridium tyrobutyricum]